MSFTIKVGLASCGLAAGAGDVYDALSKHIKTKKINVDLKKTACIGMCFSEPLVEFISEDGKSIIYGRVKPDEIPELVEKFQKGEPVQENVIISNHLEGSENTNYKNQTRIALRNCGIIDPESLDDYVANNGYNALRKVLTEYSQDDVINEIKNSGLRGRGGAGFPTGIKWSLAQRSENSKKYVVCNADEGDPGAFMDRSVLEGDPHSIIEGMIICAYAIGADEGYIYCRAEYPLAIKHLQKAITDAEKAGYLGKNIFKSKFSFKLHIKEGAGAFVCGEETALMASIEGQRGNAPDSTSIPCSIGLWGKPTNINNVETLANIAWIILNGAEEYAKFGTEKSKGTKVFALAGKIKNSGLIEVPMGMPLRRCYL